MAPDEVRPESAYQHAAVSPTFSRRESMEYDGRSRTPSVNESRSHSRATSRHGSIPALARYNSGGEEVHAPLEDVEEYEPLFPEDDSKEKNPLSAVERFKQRPDSVKHRFPSEDIWEDSPNSLQLHATVSTPDVSKEDRFETPEQEEARKTQEPAIDSHEVASRILNSEEAAPSRPALAKQRFPSRDIWEDAPESQTLVTTIEPPEEKSLTSPEMPTKPILPRRPEKREPPQVDASTKPVSSGEKRQPPSIPDRPKPQIPARPSNRGSRSNGEETTEASAKAKPAVPARPTGGKIASIKAGFLSDLNSRLQVGPQAPPKPQEQQEKPAEKGPLSDARKGRARGPARRKPAVGNASPKLPTIPEIKITETWNVWQVREDGNLVVGDSKGDQSSTAPSDPPGWNEPMAPPLARNMSGESVDPPRQPLKEEHSEAATPEAATPKPEKDAAAKTEPVKEESASTTPVPEPESTEKPVDIPAAVADNNVEAVAENLTAIADGKRPSDGD